MSQSEQKNNNIGHYKIDNIILMESSFSRAIHIKFNEGIPFNNSINIDREAHDTEDPNTFVVGLKLTFEAIQEGEKVYEIKAKFLGVFQKEGEPELDINTFKDINGPAIIYPFIREHISSIALKAGVGSVILPPVNFRS